MQKSGGRVGKLVTVQSAGWRELLEASQNNYRSSVVEEVDLMKHALVASTEWLHGMEQAGIRSKQVSWMHWWSTAVAVMVFSLVDWWIRERGNRWLDVRLQGWISLRSQSKLFVFDSGTLLAAGQSAGLYTIDVILMALRVQVACLTCTCGQFIAGGIFFGRG